MTELAATADLVVVPEQLLFPRPDRSLHWRARTGLVFFVPSTRHDFLSVASVPCLRLAALGRVFAPADPEIRAGWTFTGFWIRHGATGLDARVAAFVDGGEPPLLLTMGSMTGFDGPRLASAFVAACRGLRRRAILQRGWAGLEVPDAEDVLVVDEVDYTALFPRCAALAIHGGTGTVAHALHAGVPTVFLPSVHDQFAWAGSLTASGVAAGSADPFHATAAELSSLLARALAPEIARAATTLAAQLRQDLGVVRACALLEAYAARGPR